MSSKKQATQLERALRERVRGEVRFDAGTRAMYATDASNYRQPPIGVVVPCDAEDVIAAMKICCEHDAPIVCRGGGTSLSGQACNRAVMLEMSKYMRSVVEIEADRRRVRVEPGCVLDDMNQALSEHGLVFGPDPATHTHCTLGGMLGNNSCGIHSVMAEFYGCGPQTLHHVESLDILTYDGYRMTVGATSEAELESIIGQGGRRGEIYAALRALRDRYAAQIRARFPDIPRRVSGYSLDQLLPENGFHVARALVGTESTCVTILESCLEVYPRLPERSLCVLGYSSVFVAGDHVPRIREFGPTGLEGMDSRLAESVDKKGLHPEYLEHLPEGAGWLLVEFGADTQEEAFAKARQMMAALEKEANAPTMVLADEEQANQIWQIRESGLGATAFVPGEPDTWPGWEDSAVPPDKVGEYLRELEKVFKRHDKRGSLYGHFGQGCIHTRINFDFSSPEGIESYRRFTDEAADLCVSFGGSLSGEHGDGQARGDLLEKMYGTDIVEAFRQFKAIWDPRGRMNPGKVLPGPSRIDDLRLAQYKPEKPVTTLQFIDDGGDFRHAAMRCVGVGKCRRNSGGTMCPSFMVTHEEKHTTRGRARMMFEMMRGDVITDGWNSEAVKESLDLCLSCKGCKGDCPVNVDIALYKSEFLAHYYQKHRRPVHAYALGWIHRWARLGGTVPWLANLATQSPIRRLLARIAGLTSERAFPRFAKQPFRKQFASQATRSDGVTGNGHNGRGRHVVLWPDTFNDHFYPDVLWAATDVLEHAGYRVHIPERSLCCGRALYDYGMLDLAGKLWRQTLDALGPEIDADFPIVVIEPSCAAAFRDELPNLFPDEPRAQRLRSQTRTLAEFLVDIDYSPPRIEGSALVHRHCHQEAVIGFDADRKILAATGLDFQVLDSGCCGLAGAFGFEADHYDISMRIGERSLLPAVRGAAAETLILGDGFSCREQVSHGSDRQCQHLAEVIAEAIARGLQPEPQKQLTTSAARESHTPRVEGHP